MSNSYFDKKNKEIKQTIEPTDKPLIPIKEAIHFYTPSSLKNDIKSRIGDDNPNDEDMVNWINDGIADLNGLFSLNLPFVALPDNAQTIVESGYVDYNKPYTALPRNLFFNYLCAYTIFCYYYNDEDEINNINIIRQNLEVEKYKFGKNLFLVDDRYKWNYIPYSKQYFRKVK